MVDTLDTALSFGLEGGDVEVQIEPYGADALDAPATPARRASWVWSMPGCRSRR